MQHENVFCLTMGMMGKAIRRKEVRVKKKQACLWWPGLKPRPYHIKGENSPAARHGSCLDNQAFPWQKIRYADCTTPHAVCFRDCLC